MYYLFFYLAELIKSLAKQTKNTFPLVEISESAAIFIFVIFSYVMQLANNNRCLIDIRCGDVIF